MTEQEISAAPTSDVPDISKNLFWDDVRIGLNVLFWGVIALLLGTILAPWALPDFLVVLIVFGGGAATVLALKICASIPRESGVDHFALAAFVCGAACFVGVIVNWFSSWNWFPAVAATLLLGAASHVLFAFVLQGCVRFLNHRWLSFMAQQYIFVAVAFSLVFVVFCLTPLANNVALQLVIQILTILAAAFLLHVVYESSKVLERAQQGLPVEEPAPTADETPPAAEELVAAGPKQEPPPEEETEPPTSSVLSEKEVSGLYAEDDSAGMAIVILMTGVFSIGVVLYTIIAVMAVD